MKRPLMVFRVVDRSKQEPEVLAEWLSLPDAMALVDRIRQHAQVTVSIEFMNDDQIDA